MSKAAPVLEPLTTEARESILRDRLVLNRFPFRFGRECRVGIVADKYQSLERRNSGIPPNNEIYMLDRGRLLQVSREHFQIEHSADNGYELVDRGSTCGTIVDGRVIGGHDQGGRCPLKDGSVIKVGTAKSPYVFKFVANPA
jgi:hypothetical protein